MPNDPDLLKNEPPEVVGALQTATSRAMQPFRELISRNQTNWAVIAAAGSRWAAKVFPDSRPDEQIARLWDEINRLCRLDRPDPVAAWQQHIDELAARADFSIGNITTRCDIQDLAPSSRSACRRPTSG